MENKNNDIDNMHIKSKNIINKNKNSNHNQNILELSEGEEKEKSDNYDNINDTKSKEEFQEIKIM